jgi:hypothetical protein
MKIFISWSGERSLYIAEVLRDWLPNVIQGLEPWISSSDIEKGARWAANLAEQLEQTSFGIICLTPDNLDAPWILFEAGALSKTISQTYVCPYLLGLEPTDIKGPLVQFQAAKAERDDTRKLILTINRAQGERELSTSHIDAAFEKWWPDFEQKLQNFPSPMVRSVQRSEKDMLVELLTIARNFQKREQSASNEANRMVQALNSLVRQLHNLSRR